MPRLKKLPDLALFLLDYAHLLREARQKPTTFEKIAYLKQLIHTHEEGILFYANHANHSKPTPAVWRGIMYARAGMSEIKTGAGADNPEVFNIGWSEWGVYCKVRQLINDLENGKSLPAAIVEKVPATVIDPLLYNLYSEKLTKALGKAGKWESMIRCAAFCELLWDHKYLGEKTERVKKCNEFGKQWFADLTNQLESVQRVRRNQHKKKLQYLFK